MRSVVAVRAVTGRRRRCSHPALGEGVPRGGEQPDCRFVLVGQHHEHLRRVFLPSRETKSLGLDPFEPRLVVPAPVRERHGEPQPGTRAAWLEPHALPAMRSASSARAVLSYRSASAS